MRSTGRGILTCLLWRLSQRTLENSSGPSPTSEKAVLQTTDLAKRPTKQTNGKSMDEEKLLYWTVKAVACSGLQDSGDNRWPKKSAKKALEGWETPLLLFPLGNGKR